MKLLSTGNPKVLKGMAQGYNTYILHLAPANLSGYETCPKRSAGCTSACLNTAGRGGMFRKGESTNVIQQARIRKTRMFFENRTEFMNLLAADIRLAIKQSERLGLIPVFRLNGTSDIAFEKIRVGEYRNIMEMFPNVQFYDYTAIVGRRVPENYHLTFSAKEDNQKDMIRAFERGMNVAMVFNIKKSLPMIESYNDISVFNGDDSDLRFLDPKNVIVGLYAKGKAKKDASGFVRTIPIKVA